MRSRLAVTALLAGLASAPAVQAQKPAFDVVSIKESPPPQMLPGGAFTISMAIGPRAGGRWIAQNSTLLRLIRTAYDGFSLPGQIIGAPDWADRIRFEVNAIAPGDPPREVMNEMVKAMLADRFKLQVRLEPREVDVYLLVPVRRDGSLGTRMRPHPPCDSAEAKARDETSKLPPCGSSGRFMNGPTEKYVGTGVTLASIASMVQSAAGRPVLDRTGIASRFDVELEYAHEAGRAGAPADLTAPSVFTALQEQLGLKLEPGRERMNVLVIEQAEMPSPD